jgi:hypothetical protein
MNRSYPIPYGLTKRRYTSIAQTFLAAGFDPCQILATNPAEADKTTITDSSFAFHLPMRKNRT